MPYLMQQASPDSRSPVCNSLTVCPWALIPSVGKMEIAMSVWNGFKNQKNAREIPSAGLGTREGPRHNYTLRMIAHGVIPSHLHAQLL